MARIAPAGPPTTRRGLLRGAFAAGAAALLPAGALPAARAAEPRLAFREIAPGVFAHEAPIAMPGPGNAGDIANLGFVVGEAGVAVIDAGGSPAVGRAALAAVRAVTDRPVRHLILTHMHPDHVFGAKAFAEAGATVHAHRRLPDALRARAETYGANMASALGSEALAGFSPTLPDETVAGEAELDLGNRTLHLKAWDTAHTDNDLTVFDAATGTLFAGDLVFLDHIPVVDGSLLGWLDQRGALAALPAAQVVPGHGPVPSPWPGALEPEMAYLEALAAELRTAIAAGMPMAEAARRVGEEAAAMWSLAEEFHVRNVTAAYAELEWE